MHYTILRVPSNIQTPFNATVRYRMYLESRRVAANAISQQLAPVRRLAHEAPIPVCCVPSWLPGSAASKGSNSSDCGPAIG
jgi:hypothetical protein